MHGHQFTILFHCVRLLPQHCKLPLPCSLNEAIFEHIWTWGRGNLCWLYCHRCTFESYLDFQHFLYLQAKPSALPQWMAQTVHSRAMVSSLSMNAFVSYCHIMDSLMASHAMRVWCSATQEVVVVDENALIEIVSRCWVYQTHKANPFLLTDDDANFASALLYEVCLTTVRGAVMGSGKRRGSNSLLFKYCPHFQKSLRFVTTLSLSFCVCPIYQTAR